MAIIGEMKKLTIGGSTYTIPEYSLPIASASTLGGVRIGTGLTINSTTGVLSATGLDFDEADPVFTASAAYGITSTDITNWNSKTSNTGTITKVQTSAGAHTTVNVSSGNVSFNVPTKTSHLTNDSGFLTSSDLASVLKYKGTKASVANLPTTNNATGDVWHITADGSEYAWDGNIWQELGTSIDLSGYALKSELPTDTNTWRTIQVNDSDVLGSGINTGKLNLKAGNAITLSESSGTVTFNHSDTSSQASSSNSGRTYIQSITLDTYGHVTSISTATETVTNTDTKLQVAAVTSGTTYYPIVGTGTTAATRQYDTTGFIYKGTNGTTSTIGSAQLTLGNSTASGTANNKQGQLIMYGSNAKKATITLAAPSADISLALPTSGGTLALTSQIPTVPTNVSAFTNDAGYITDSDIPEGASAYTGTPSAVSTTASTGTSNAFARGDHVHDITSSTITSALGYTPYNSTNPNGYITASHTSTYSLPLAASGTRGGVQIGYSESGTNYAVKLSSEKMYVTVPWTDTKVTTAALSSGTTYYPILATGTGTATRQIDSTLGGLKYISTAGSTSAVGTAILHLGNSTASGSSNNEQGVLRIYTVNTRYVDIKTESTFTPTGSRNRYLPSYDADMYLTGTNTTNAVGGATTAPVYVDNTGCIQAVTSIPYSLLTGTPTIPTVPTSTGSNTTGITASTTATKTTLGTASSIYGVKSGTNSTTTASKASGSNGSASTWVFEDVACDDITAWSAGSGSASFSATVSSHVLSFSHSHTHTAPSLTYSAKTASHVKSGGNGTAPSWSFTDVTVPIRADSATSVPNVSVASATVSITDPGHTHTI